MSTSQPPASKLDLSQLAVDRTDRKEEMRATIPKRRWFSRYVLPAGILLAFVMLFVWSARDSFLPATAVTVTPVVVTDAEVRREGTPLFQAAGWIEPRPTPVVAAALAAGVIEDLLVIEGQQVTKGEPVARLIDIDAKMRVRKAKSTLQLRKAELQRAEAALTAAKENLANPTELEAALGDAEAKLANTRLQLVNLPYQLEAARTAQQLAADNLERKEQAGEAVSGRVLREARAELAAANSKVNELVSREPTLQAELEALTRRKRALAKQFELLTEQRREVSVAEAEVAAAQANVEQAQVALETAELELERMIVRAPIRGRVLRLEASPGQRLSGINPHSEQGSNAVVSLYDPQSLQVRVDVRLQDVPQVQPGQTAWIETAALDEPITGKVISVTTFADIQKNTLQVKVGVESPPEVIKPEMLAKVTFLAPPSQVAEAQKGSERLRLFIPQSLVQVSDGVSSVWVADLTAGTAVRKTVEIGQGTTEKGLVEVERGLVPTDKLIVAGRETLSQGSRVRVTGEDRSTTPQERSNDKPASQPAQLSDPTS